MCWHIRMWEMIAAFVLRARAFSVSGYEVCFISEIGRRVKGFVVKV